MASMISGDFVQAYVLKNASKEKMKSAEAAAAQAGNKPQSAGDGPAAKKAAEEVEAGGKSAGSGFLVGFGQKVHLQVGGTGASS
jgi:hypothetical protein